MNKRENPWASLGWLALGSPLALLILLAVVALVMATPPSLFWNQLQEPDTRQAVVISLRTTLISIAVIVLFGTCLAMAVRHSKPAVASALELFITMPAIIPPSVAGITLLLAFGRQGLLGGALHTSGIYLAFTPTAVVMAQVFVATPFFVREAITAFRSLDPVLLEAATLDGASGSAMARSIVLPITLPFLATGAVLAWARALGEFGATILFAGNLKGVTQTMPLAIYLGFESDLDQAKALALLLLILAVVVLVLVRVVLGRRLAFAH